jgi:hypothetical protein
MQVYVCFTAIVHVTDPSDVLLKKMLSFDLSKKKKKKYEGICCLSVCLLMLEILLFSELEDYVLNCCAMLQLS